MQTRETLESSCEAERVCIYDIYLKLGWAEKPIIFPAD